MLKNAKLTLCAAVFTAAISALPQQAEAAAGFAGSTSTPSTQDQYSNAQQPAKPLNEQQLRRPRPVPKPRGFDEVDNRFRAPMGFYQNRTDNTIKNLKDKGKDGDYAVIAGIIVQDLGSDCYVLEDDAHDQIEFCRMPSTQPKDLALHAGHRYLLWTQIDRQLFSLSLDLLVFAEADH